MDNEIFNLIGEVNRIFGQAFESRVTMGHVSRGSKLPYPQLFNEVIAYRKVRDSAVYEIWEVDLHLMVVPDPVEKTRYSDYINNLEVSKKFTNIQYKVGDDIYHNQGKNIKVVPGEDMTHIYVTYPLYTKPIMETGELMRILQRSDTVEYES